ncbi:hypothetical protein IHQ71_01330 [Rhizobium sp. TH2]|uniref:hypothetical protein n=1 Tax=Rhizobium sp. TH2 TaxID=2775403 RepID=UPI0021571FF3|nr:hypothetical protein [Rhizobium sp. TH2]UVC09302.1 hypothetical protein IHQ71_01330 [Rhizobium sp. TH2]
MKIEFLTRKLALIETDRAAETKLPIAVIQSARLKLTLLRAAPDIGTLQGWKSLGYRETSRGSDVEHTIFVTPEWEMNMQFQIEQDSTRVVVVSMKECSRESA